MTEDTTIIPEMDANELSTSITNKANALSNLMYSIEECAGATLPNGVNSLHECEAFAEAELVYPVLERINLRLMQSLEMLAPFTPKPFEYQKTISKVVEMEVSALCEFQVMAFSEEAADDLKEELDDDDIIERAGIDEVEDCDVMIGNEDWTCDSLS